MALKKLFFGKNIKETDGQDEYFKDDFEPVFYPSHPKKNESKSAQPAVKEEKKPVEKAAPAFKKSEVKAAPTTKKSDAKSATKSSANATTQTKAKSAAKSERAKKPASKSASAAKTARSTPTKASTSTAKKPAAKEAVAKAPASKSAKSTVKPTAAGATTKSTATKSSVKSTAKAPAKTAAKASTKSKKAAGDADLVDGSPLVKGAVAVSSSRETANGKWEIRRAKDGRFFFALYASNHTVIAYSQIYSSITAVNTGINSVIANAQKCETEDTTLKKLISLPCPKWEIYLDKAEEYRFRLYAPNGLCICHSSHGYASKSGVKGCIESIKRFSVEAVVDKSYLK